jgi:hypothetical protein
VTLRLYWSASQLSVFVDALSDLVRCDRKGFYFPPLSLAATVAHALAQRDMALPISDVADGLKILTHLGILDQPCICAESSRAHCKRRYHPWRAPLLLGTSIEATKLPSLSTRL